VEALLEVRAAQQPALGCSISVWRADSLPGLRLMLGSFLGSLALGLVKGLTSKNGAQGFSSEHDIYGPIREELMYRGAPLWAAPGLPFGATAVNFAVDHVLSDARHGQMSASQVVARFGDVLLGGLAYESAMRSNGIVGAIVNHATHNFSVGLGSRLRNRKKP